MTMKSSKTSSTTTLLLLFLIVFITFCLVSVEARKHQNKKTTPPQNKSHNNKDGNGNNTPDSHPCSFPSPPHYGPHQHPPSTSFSISSFGAKGDGISDDSKALLAAWGAACRVEGAKVEIPSNSRFLIKPITLQGPCMPGLVLQIDGTLLAPPALNSWPKSNLSQWINFKWVQNFTVQGTGVVDGQGTAWWKTSTNTPPHNLQHKSNSKHNNPIKKPTALRFYCGLDVTVRNIKIINSPQCHLKFDNSKGIKVHNININSPERSKNTDGIHLQNTQNVEIHQSNIGCGDDCISIQTGCSNVHIHGIHCGPGHGISLGGLGENESVACVSNVVVNNSSFRDTDTGVRIKTWPGGKGSVKNVSFSNIRVSNVKVPIVIDQNYCDKQKKDCKKSQIIMSGSSPGGVAISGVKYDGIIGSYLEQPILLNCSSDTPCTDVDLSSIRLHLPPAYLPKKKLENGRLCQNSYGKSTNPLAPSIIDSCLRRDGGPIRIAKAHKENMC